MPVIWQPGKKKGRTANPAIDLLGDPGTLKSLDLFLPYITRIRTDVVHPRIRTLLPHVQPLGLPVSQVGGPLGTGESGK